MTPITIEYYFEQDQEFLFLVHDSDNFDKDYSALKDSKYIGECSFKIQNLVCNPDKQINLALYNSKEQKGEGVGQAKIAYEEMVS